MEGIYIAWGWGHGFRREGLRGNRRTVEESEGRKE